MKTTAVQRVVNCLVAEKRALHGEFKAYWKKTAQDIATKNNIDCLLYTSPSPRDGLLSRMPSSA